MNPRISDKETARLNEIAVQEYLNTTPLSKLPKNKNYKKLNRTRILVILGLKKNARYNQTIKNLFGTLDAQLGENSIESPSGDAGDSASDLTGSRMGCGERRKLENRIKELERELAIRNDEINGMRQEMNGEKWFLAYGRQIRR